MLPLLLANRQVIQASLIKPWTKRKGKNIFQPCSILRTTGRRNHVRVPATSAHLVKDRIPLRLSVTNEDNPENSQAGVKVKLRSIQMGLMASGL